MDETTSSPSKSLLSRTGSDDRSREGLPEKLPTDAAEIVTRAVTALFVPGDRPERFAKAAAAVPGMVIIDLEDAVAPEAKAEALRATLAALSPGGASALRALVRVNASGSHYYDAETAALLQAARIPGHRLLGLMVPKAEDPDALRNLASRLAQTGSLALVPLIESAAGMVAALEIARVPGVARLAFGAIDYALDIDADNDDRFLDHARSHLVVASRAAGIPAPLDSPSTDIQDMSRVETAAKAANSFGFGGKLCIHPAQLDPVRKAFAPSQADIDWADSVIGAQGSAAQVDGQMVDVPVIERAKRILARARI
ncbi:HpcH/HpaI aldolase/citrate lyase family protein [Arthrobacter sp. B6]|uniref:HpcH/HpaI aldolase/citrate lyase family protein n=1 Tax=Arthrobacter sp. B6 TaxID=1570137 RepID=UPI0009ECD3DD|nr:CoA ester lyase [Arthrobacter sp. B6]